MEKLIKLLNDDYGFSIVDLPETTPLIELTKINPEFDSLTVIQFIIDAEDKLNFEIPVGVNPKTFHDILIYMKDVK